MISKTSKVKTPDGFSLIELSIVLLIVGLIVSSVVGGSKMITLSNLTKARALTNSSPVNGIEDLFLWLESTSKSSFNTVPINGSAISVWNDINPQLTVKGNAIQAAGVSQPIYTEKVINGLPAIKFDGVNDFMTSKTIDDWRFFQQGAENSFLLFCKLLALIQIVLYYRFQHQMRLRSRG